jgi:hypothetical protein
MVGLHNVHSNRLLQGYIQQSAADITRNITVTAISCMIWKSQGTDIHDRSKRPTLSSFSFIIFIQLFFLSNFSPDLYGFKILKNLTVLCESRSHYIQLLIESC